MKQQLYNPFPTGGYIDPDYFCNRHTETKHLLKAIASQRNVTLISLRRMGKTGLLKHVQHHLAAGKGKEQVLYIDLLSTMSGQEMLNQMARSLMRLQHREKNWAERIMAALASLRPRMSYDPLNGLPTIDVSVATPEDISYGLNQLLELLDTLNLPVIFMIDEFQQITHYPEANIEQQLRTIIQAFPQITFIFSGSSHHILEAMFAASDRPFYQSSELMYLERIDPEVYGVFIREHFAKAKRSINPGALHELFEWTRGHTYYVQYICNRLFESEIKKIDEVQLRAMFHKVLKENEPLYTNYRNLLPAHQFRLLQAIASENRVAQPTAGAFVLQYELTSASSVKTSLTALQNKEMIFREAAAWLVSDVFFSRWLEYHYGSSL